MTNEELFHSIYCGKIDSMHKNNQDSVKRLQLTSDFIDAQRKFYSVPGITGEMKKAFEAVLEAAAKLSEFERVDMYGCGFRLGGKMAFAMMETPMDPDVDETDDPEDPNE